MNVQMKHYIVQFFCMNMMMMMKHYIVQFFRMNMMVMMKHYTRLHDLPCMNCAEYDDETLHSLILCESNRLF
jgi:hypothetical protein